MTNFGVEPFLDHFVDLAPPPRTRTTSAGPLPPDDPRFTGLRLQDPGEHGSAAPRSHRVHAHLLGPVPARHGRARTCAPARRSRSRGPLQFMAQERTADRRGLFGRHHRALGSRASCASATRSVRGRRRSSSRASRASRPSTSCACGSTDPLKRKQLKKGLDQLSEEGAVQLFFDRTRLERDPDPRRRRRAAVRGHPAPPEVRVRRQGRLRPPALPPRPLDRRRGRSTSTSSSAPAGPPASSTSRSARWSCSTTNGPSGRRRRITPS